MKTCIFIPAWNVRKQINELLERIPAELGRSCSEVFVLDNASSDGTAEAVSHQVGKGFPFAVNIYRNRFNLGYGGSQKAAYQHAIDKGYDLVVMLHGDGQYPPRHIPLLLNALRDSSAGMAYGSRLLQLAEKDETPLHRRLGVQGLSKLQNLASGLSLAEWYSGFRAFRCSALKQVPFQACDSDYYFDVQIILLLAMADFAIAELPVAKKYEGNESPVNIYQFGRKVLAHMLHYPLARAGLLPGKLFRKKHWAELARTAIPELVPFQMSKPKLEMVAAA